MDLYNLASYHALVGSIWLQERRVLKESGQETFQDSICIRAARCSGRNTEPLAESIKLVSNILYQKTVING